MNSQVIIFHSSLSPYMRTVIPRVMEWKQKKVDVQKTRRPSPGAEGKHRLLQLHTPRDTGIIEQVVNSDY